MTKLKLKACPKCKGDLQLRKDHDGAYLSCFQCGYAKDLIPLAGPLPPKGAYAEQHIGPATEFRDGCEVCPSCLSCPLPRCKYDDPELWRREVRDKYDTQIVGTFESFWGLASEKRAEKTARVLNIKTRTVYRALARQKERTEVVK